MSEAKFTKGEWVVKHGSGCKVYSGNTLICLIKHAPNQSHGHQPNAPLIAAAPEMYDYLFHMIEHDVINDPSIEREVKSLLAKARGEHE